MQTVPNLFHIVMSPADDWRAWYVYQLYNYTDVDKCVFVGWSDARELLTFANARQNTAYARHMQAFPDAKFWLVVLSKHATKNEAMAAGGRLVHQLKPEFNMTGYFSGRKRAVRCINNGMEFNSVTDAARWLDVASSSMSSHLSRRPGYAHLKNHMFERID